MNNKETVDYVESMIAKLTGDDSRGADIYEPEEIVISLNENNAETESEASISPIVIDNTPKEDFSYSDNDHAIYTSEDKEHLEFLYSIFGSMDEARLRALASDLENATIGNSSIDLTTDADKNRFLACLDKLTLDENAMTQERSAIVEALDEVFSDDIKTYIYLLPTNPNVIKRMFYGRFDGELSEEDIDLLCDCIDEAIGDSVLNSDTIDAVKFAFLETEFVSTLTKEQLDLALQAIDDAVYTEEDVRDVFVRVIQAKLAEVVEDDRKIISCREAIRNVVDRLMDLRSISDVDGDIRGYLESIEMSEADINTVSETFQDAAFPYLTSDNVDSVLAELFEVISAFTDEPTRDEIRLIVESSISGNSYTVNEAKEDILRYISEYTFANKIQAEEIETIKLAFKEAVGESLSLDNLNVNIANFESIAAKVITAEQLNATKATIREATIDTLYVNTLNAKLAVIEHAIIEELEANYAHITNGVIDNAKIGYADVKDLNANYAQIDLANVNNAWIDNGVIKDAAISDAKIVGVSANKLTAGTIDASKINVTNLDADQITTGRLVVDGLLIDLDTATAAVDGGAIEEGTVPLGALAQDVKDVIDGAIETFTGTAVPTLNNYPASSWADNATKAKHVGDVYYVVNSGQQADGYCYRFAKNGNAYEWVLIKDSDVTAALQRLITAEGNIEGLQDFESETSSWMTDTDEELSSVKSNVTSLTTRVDTAEGDIQTKVDKSTFNTLSQTVDANSSNITSLSTIASNNGLTSKTNITNTVNTVSQTASGNSSKISSLTTTLGTNADGTTKTGDIVHRTSAVEQDLSGFKTTVSSTYAAKSTVYTKSEIDQKESSINASVSAKADASSTTASLALKANKATLTSEINASADTVKINANRVNVDGTLIVGKSDVDSAINDLEIGGRNLIQGTGDFSIWNWPGSYIGLMSINDGIFKFKGNTQKQWAALCSPSIRFEDVEGKSITLSYEVRSDDYASLPDAGYPAITFLLKDKGPEATGYGDRQKGKLGFSPNVITNEWKKYSFTIPNIKLSDFTQSYGTGDPTWLCICVWFYQLPSVEFRRFKLEFGDKATDWTPAPEDVQAEIDAKKSVHTLMSSTSGSTYKNILTWTAEGRENISWPIDTTATPLTDVKIGDTCRVAYKVTDMNNAYVYVVGELTSISGSTIYMTMHGLDTTIIDGGNILTNSIGANQIAANSIGAKHLTISDTTNLATANELYEASLPSDLSADWAPSINGGYLVKKTATQGYLMANHYTPNSFKNGDELYYEFYGKAATAGTVRFGAWCCNSSGSFLANTSANINLTTTEKFYSGTIKMSSTSWDTAAKYVLGFNDNRSTKSQIYIRKLIIRRKEDAIRYITDINGTGIKVHAASNETSNYSQIDGDGMSVYKGGTKRAEFFDSVNLYASDGSKSIKTASFSGDGVSLHSASLENVGRFYVTSDTKDGKTRTFGTLSLGSAENPVIKGYNYTGTGAEDISALIMGVNGTEWDSKFTASLDFTGMEFQQDNVGYWRAGLQAGGFYVGGPSGTLMGVDSSGLSIGGNALADYVIKRGTSGSWTYMKWASGTAMCYGTITSNVSKWDPWGALYYGTMHYFNYPSGLFAAEPTLTAQAKMGSGSSGDLFSVGFSNDGSASRTPTMYPTRPTAGLTGSIYYHLQAWGRWK